MNSELLVSIIIPLYNAERYLAEAIESVLDQTYKKLEVLIVNDGSTDNSLAIARSFERENVKVYDQPNRGASAARNYGFLQSKGEFIKFFDADDLMNPIMIEAQINLAIDNPYSIVSAKWGRFYGDDTITFKLNPEECWQNMLPIDWICSSWKSGASMTQPGIFLIPRTIIEQAGLWDESLSLIDDLEYFTKAILKCKNVVFCQNAVLYYRSGLKNALSGQKSETAILSAKKALEKSQDYILGVENSERTRLIIANSWQTLLYSYFNSLVFCEKEIEFNIKRLGGSNVRKYNNGIGNIAEFFLGWKKVAKFKKWLQ